VRNVRVVSEKPMWREVLVEKYGREVWRLLERGGATCPWYASTWWKDLLFLQDSVGFTWFNSKVVRYADDGWRTNFWEDKWRGNSKLCEQFPSLFAISIYKEVSVREMWELTNSFEEFDLPWRRTLFVWERRLLNDMLEVLEGFYCSQGTDSWKWRPEENGLFSVNSAYILLEKLMVWEERWGEVEKKVFRYLWKGQLLLLEWFLSL